MAIRDRLCPAPEQEQVLRMHCDQARYVRNLAVEQQAWWWPGRGRAPGYVHHARISRRPQPAQRGEPPGAPHERPRNPVLQGEEDVNS